MYEEYLKQIRGKVTQWAGDTLSGSIDKVKTQLAESENRRGLGQRQAEELKGKLRDVEAAASTESNFGFDAVSTIGEVFGIEQKNKQEPVRMATTGQSAVDYRPYEGKNTSLLGLMDEREGGGSYATLFGHSQKEGGKFANVDVSTMTIGELKAFSDTSGEYGQWVKQQLGASGQKARVATPMGRYQFVGSTMAEVAAKMGISDDTVFTPAVQDNMFAFYAQQVYNKDGVAGLKNAWEGFRGVSDDVLQRAYQNEFTKPKQRPLVKRKGNVQ